MVDNGCLECLLRFALACGWCDAAHKVFNEVIPGTSDFDRIILSDRNEDILSGLNSMQELLYAELHGVKDEVRVMVFAYREFQRVVYLRYIYLTLYRRYSTHYLEKFKTTNEALNVAFVALLKAVLNYRRIS